MLIEKIQLGGVCLLALISPVTIQFQGYKHSHNFIQFCFQTIYLDYILIIDNYINHLSNENDYHITGRTNNRTNTGK